MLADMKYETRQQQVEARLICKHLSVRLFPKV